jgi:hypothetical protein
MATASHRERQRDYCRAGDRIRGEGIGRCSLPAYALVAGTVTQPYGGVQGKQSFISTVGDDSLRAIARATSYSRGAVRTHAFREAFARTG